MAPLPDHNNIDYQLLVNVLDGQATPEESATVAAWREASAENRELYFRVKDILDSQRATNLQLDVKARWEEVSVQLPGSRTSWWKYAAMIAVLLLAGGAAFWMSNRKPAIQMAMSEKVQSTILPDGTRVWLKEGSTLAYRPSFGKSNREVWVDGTAYFDVDQQSAHPFVAHTDQLNVTVLGTSFTVQEDAVILSSGKVKAAAGKEELVLQPGERASVQTGTMHKNKVNAQLYAAWRDGEFRFENTSLAEIKELLVTIYGYNVEIRQPAAFSGTALSGHVTMTNEIEMKEVLSAMLNARIEITGKKMIIQPK